jgi:Flp pilus assembly pilin Flp
MLAVKLKGIFMSKGRFSLLKNEKGVTSIEYAILAGVISLVIVGGATAVGRVLINPFNVAAGALGS